MTAQSGEFLPRLAAVLRAEQGGVLHAGVHHVRVGKRRFEMPDSLELPRVLRSVVPLMTGEGFPAFRRRVVGELVAFALGRSLWSGRRFTRRSPWLYPSLAA